MLNGTVPNQVDGKLSRLDNLKLSLSKLNLKKILGVSFILILIIALGYIIYSHIKKQPAQISQTINLQELRKIITPEIKQCLLNKLGNSKAKRLVEEAKKSKEIPPEAMPAIRSCVPASLLTRLFPSNTPINITPPSAPGVQTVPSSGIALGVYQPAADPFSHGTAVDKYTEEVGKKPAFAWFSVRWQNGNTGVYQQFDPALVEQYRTRGIMPGLNWDASKGSALTRGQTDFSWAAINSGKHDAYITQTAQAVAAYHYPFLMRLFAEMDGPWYPWGYNAEGQGNTNPADFVTAWKHIVDIFRKEGATNVQFVWCWATTILTSSQINQSANILKGLYPGDDYVDWIALDGYSNLADKGRTYQDIVQPSYQFLKTFTHRPIILYEIGALENPNDPMAKANWITTTFLTTIPTVFPDIKVVNWFNGPSDYNPTKPNRPTVSWAVDSSQNSLNAWKQVVASPLYQGSLLK